MEFTVPSEMVRQTPHRCSVVVVDIGTPRRTLLSLHSSFPGDSGSELTEFSSFSTLTREDRLGNTSTVVLHSSAILCGDSADKQYPI